MAKKDTNKRDDKRLERSIMRNWIIMGVSLILIIVLYSIGK